MDVGVLDASEDTQRWCLGLALAGWRGLDVHERRALYRRARASRRVFRRAVAGSVGALVGGAAALAAAWAPAWSHVAGYAWAVAALALGLLVPSLAMLAREHLRRARATLADLENGLVERYEGALGSIDTLDSAARGLLERGLFEPDPRRTQHVEVTPRARLVVRVNGRPAEKSLRAPAVEVARPRPHGYATRLPGDLVQVENDTHLLVLRRSLTPTEMSELHQRGLAFRRRFWWSSTLAAGPAAALAVWLAGLMTSQRWLQAAAGVLSIVSVVFVSYHVWLRLTRRIEADRALRWVITMRNDAGAGSELEVLPASGLVWTEREKPAGWRLSAR